LCVALSTQSPDVSSTTTPRSSDLAGEPPRATRGEERARLRRVTDGRRGCCGCPARAREADRRGEPRGGEPRGGGTCCARESRATKGVRSGQHGPSFG